jgi:hypothetical protein
MNKTQLMQKIASTPARSAWSKGVKNYALDLIDEYDGDGEITEQALLNGASDWQQYSEGGCALAYNCLIAAALCTPSKLKKTDGGRLPPNSRETWLDVQARALHHAWRLIERSI